MLIGLGDGTTIGDRIATSGRMGRRRLTGLLRLFRREPTALLELPSMSDRFPPSRYAQSEPARAVLVTSQVPSA